MGRGAPGGGGRRYLAGALALLSLSALWLGLTADDSPELGRRLFGLWRPRNAAPAAALGLGAVLLLAGAVSRRALRAGVAAVLGVGAVWLALELAGVAGLVSWPERLGPQVSDLGRQAVPDLDVRGTTTQDTANAWGQASEPIPFRYRTDRRGFRNEPDRAEGDVILLGDSMLVSALLPFEQTLAAQLEARIHRPVVQVALNGVGPEREQELFRTSGLAAKGRLVLQVVFEGDDLYDSYQLALHGSAAPPSPEPGLAERTLLHQIVTRLAHLTQPVASVAQRASCAIGGRTYTFAFTRAAYEPYAGQTSVIGAALDNFDREVRGAGGTFGVVLVPDKLRVLAGLCELPPGSPLVPLEPNLSPLRDYLLAWADATKVPLLDLTGPLTDAARAGRIPWFWGDTHWNAAGSEVAADALARWSLVGEAKPPG